MKPLSTPIERGSEPPFLSVIVPAYNAGETLETCLASLERGFQTGTPNFDDFEVIVVDDGSVDNTAEIASRFKCRLISQGENQGTAKARNAGAQRARGEILVFVDADVALKPDALLNLSEFFESHPDVDAAVGTYTERIILGSRFQTGSPNFVSTYHNFFTFYHHELSPESIEWFWGAIGAVRRWVFEAVGGFDEQFHGASAEDMDLGYTLALAGRKISYIRSVKGDHLHRFTLSSMLFNDYRKAVLGIKLYLTRKSPDRHEHGFGNPRNAVTLVMVFLFMFCLLLCWAGLAGHLSLVLCIMTLLGVNWPFYRFMLRRMGSGFVLKAIGLHWLSFLVIGLGVFMGLLGLVLGRDIYSRSPWM